MKSKPSDKQDGTPAVRSTFLLGAIRAALEHPADTGYRSDALNAMEELQGAAKLRKRRAPPKKCRKCGSSYVGPPEYKCLRCGAPNKKVSE